MQKLFIIILFLSTQIYSQNNWKVTFSDSNFISGVKLLKISGDSLKVSKRRMIVKVPIDSIIELRKEIGGFELGIKRGAVIGLVTGFVYGGLIIAPNQNNIDEQIYTILKTSFVVGAVGGFIGTIVGLFTPDDLYDFSKLNKDEK